MYNVILAEMTKKHECGARPRAAMHEYPEPVKNQARTSASWQLSLNIRPVQCLSLLFLSITLFRSEDSSKLVSEPFRCLVFYGKSSDLAYCISQYTSVFLLAGFSYSSVHLPFYVLHDCPSPVENFPSDPSATIIKLKIDE